MVASTPQSASAFFALFDFFFLPGTFKISEVDEFHLFVVTLLPIKSMGTNMAQVSFTTVATGLGSTHKGVN